MKKNIVYLLVLVIGLLGVSGMAFRVRWATASGTIYIRATGEVEGTDKISSADNVTYTFTGDINDSIIIERGNITIDGEGYKLQGTGSGTGIYVDVFEWAQNVTIKNIEIVSFEEGIGLSGSGNITISANKIGNCSSGIAFGESYDNVISGNIITNNTNGIGGNTVMDTVISGNIITNNTNGILFSWAQNNTIYLNNITNNEYGIYIEGTYDFINNTFYHNNFINNTNQVYWYLSDGSINTWDDGYPSGGNYWDDFPDLYPLVGDDYSGSDQNEAGSDGIWDSPYSIDGNNTDRYPLTTVIPEFPSSIVLLLLLMTATLVSVIAHKRRRALAQIGKGMRRS